MLSSSPTRVSRTAPRASVDSASARNRFWRFSAMRTSRLPRPAGGGARGRSHARAAAQHAAEEQSAGVEASRVSFAQVREQTGALCQIFSLGDDLSGVEQRVQRRRRVLTLWATTALIQRCKPRTCQRALHQPAKDWPKMRKPKSRMSGKHIVVPNPQKLWALAGLAHRRPELVGLKPELHHHHATRICLSELVAGC